MNKSKLSQLKVILVHILILLCAKTYANTHPTYNQLLSSLKTLEPQVGKVVVILIRGRIIINNDKTITHNLSKSSNERLWALKSISRQNALMTELSETVNWDNLKLYYEKETEYSSNLIRGNINTEKYLYLSKLNQKRLITALSDIRRSQSKFTKIHDSHLALINRLSTSIIAKSKLHAIN